MATGARDSKPPLPWSPLYHLRPLNNSTGETSVSSRSTASSGRTEDPPLPWSQHYHLKPLNGSTGKTSLSSGSSDSNGSGLYSNRSFSLDIDGSSPPSSDHCRKIANSSDRKDRDACIRETRAAQTDHEGPPETHRQDFRQETKLQHQGTRSSALKTPREGNERRGEHVQIDPDVETLKKPVFPTQHRVIGIAIVFLMVAAIAGVIVYNELRKASDLGKIYQTTGLVSVSVDDIFNASMADNSSAEFSAFSKKFCDSAGTILAESDSADVVACTVHSLSKGSIVTTFTLELQTAFNMSSDWLKDLLQNSGVQDDGFTYWFNLRINRSSIRVAYLESKLSDSTVLGPYTSKVDCTQLFLPLPYTYPNYCGEYQACTSTGIKYFRCPEDFEFSYDSSTKTDITVCERRSENTYCGQRRREDLASTMATATRPTDTATATETTDATTTETKPWNETTSIASSMTASVQTAVAMSTSLPCSAILVNKTLSELFHCPPTGYVFIPRYNTYPDHCNSYVWCVDGVTYNSSKIGCGAGAHYTTMEDGPCYPVWHPNTFCQVMRRCQDLLAQIKGYTTPSTTFADMTETPG